MKTLILISLIVLLILLAACGKPSDEQEPPANQEAVVNCAETIAAHQYLLKKHAELQGILERSQAKQAEYATAVRILEDANLELRIELALVKGLEEGRAGGYEDLLNELAALRAERKNWDNLSKIRYASILKQYNELAALYPLKSFPNHDTLVEWRYDAGNITEDKPLWVLQQMAADEGYLIVVGYNIPYGMTIVGDYWYKLVSGDKCLVEKLGKVE